MLIPRKIPPTKQKEKTPPAHLTEPEEDNPNLELPGHPGYRTQAGHSGLDPIESYSELGYVMGICLRDLLYFRLRTRNALSLIGMFLVGFIFLAPLGTTVLFLSTLGEAALPLLFFTFLPAVLGLLLWTNLALNLADLMKRRSSRR